MLCCCQLEILDNFIFEPVFHKRSQMQNWSMLFEPEVPYFLFYNRPSKLSSQSWPWTWSRWLRWVLQKTESALWSALSTRAKALTQSRHDDDHSKTHGGFSEPVLGSLIFIEILIWENIQKAFYKWKHTIRTTLTQPSFLFQGSVCFNLSWNLGPQVLSHWHLRVWFTTQPHTGRSVAILQTWLDGSLVDSRKHRCLPESSAPHLWGWEEQC